MKFNGMALTGREGSVGVGSGSEEGSSTMLGFEDGLGLGSV
jgi:hypothetical protein